MKATFKGSSQTPTPLKTKPSPFQHQFGNLSLYQKTATGELLQCSRGALDAATIEVPFENGLIGAISDAYNYHHNIVLRAEDFWMAILTQFSLYVNANGEQFRNTFVDFQGKKELSVSCPGSIRSAPYDWLSCQMTHEIQKNLKDDSIRSWILPNFSTTNKNDEISFSVVMMAAMQKYFSYKFSLCCGIPEISLLGTVKDYQDLKSKIDKLPEFDLGDGILKKWHGYLSKIGDQLISSAAGKSDYDFWGKICHHTHTGSGPSYLSGWISTFACFSEKGIWQGDKTEIRTWIGQTIQSEFPILDMGDVPPGVVSVPVKIDDNGVPYNTMMFAGSFIANAVDQVTLEPRIDWAIALVDEKKVKKTEEY